MPLQINNKKLIPAPLLTIQKQLVFNDDGTPLNSIYNITAEGYLLPNKGSPTSRGFYTGFGEPDDENWSTDEDCHNSLILKQEALRELVSTTGYQVLYSPPGFKSVEFFPKLKNFNVQPGTWVTLCQYTIDWETPYLQRDGTAEDELLYVSGTQHLNLKSVGDDYTFKEREDGTQVIEITRVTSATANIAYVSSGILHASGTSNIYPWQNARTWVLSRVRDMPFGSGISAQFNIAVSGVDAGATNSIYNLIREESINEFAGSYTLSQRFIYHRNNYIDNRTISKNTTLPKLGDGGPAVDNITVNGLITGLTTSVSGFDPSGRYNNALTYWNSISNGLGLAVGAFGYPVNTNITYDQFNGTIGYNANYINNYSGNTYKHNYNVNYTIGQTDYPSVTIAGSIEGVTSDDFYNSASGTNKLNYAVSGWQNVSGSLKSLAFAYTTLMGNSSDYFDNPSTRSIGYDHTNGILNYSYTYNYSTNASKGYLHTYQIEYNTDNTVSDSISQYGGLISTATINGQINGIASNISDPTSRAANARIGWSEIQTTLYSLVNNDYTLIGVNKPPLGSGYVRRVVGLNPQAGQITYSANFNNFPRPSSSLVAAQDVTVEEGYATDVFAIQIIPGRQSGPIIQNINTTGPRTRTINIALTMFPNTGSPYTYTFADKSTPYGVASGIVASLVPAGARGSGYYFSGYSDRWDWRNGFYTQTVVITY